MSNFKDLTMRDIETLSDIPKIKSLRSYALSKSLTPANLSKIIQKLEKSTEHKLLVRSNLGVKATHEAIEIALKAKEVLKSLEVMAMTKTSEGIDEFTQTITVGTRGFLNAALAPAILKSLKENGLNFEVRFVDLSPDDLRQAIRHGDVDMAITLEKENYGNLWHSKRVASLEWGVYARSGHPLQNKKPSLEEVSEYFFTSPTYWDGTKVKRMDDKLPIPKEYKNFGHGIQTTQTAISVITVTDQLTFIPFISAKRSEKLGEIVNIKMPTTKKVKDQLYIHVHQDRIDQRTYTAISEAVKMAAIH